MSLTVDFSEEGDILVVCARGAVDPVSDEEFDRTIAAEAKRRGYRKLLVDFRQVDGKPAAMDSYQSGVSLSQRGFTKDMMLAFVDREEFKEANDFYETVATNRGFMVRHFYTLDDARAWLERKPGDPTDSR